MAPGQLPENIRVWEGDVGEKPDTHIGSQLPQNPGNQLQLVVLHPHGGTWGGDYRGVLSESCVDIPVCRPPCAVVGRRNDQVVVQRPQGGVGKAFIKGGEVVFRQRHGVEQRPGVVVEWFRGGIGDTRPADPAALPGFQNGR